MIDFNDWLDEHFETDNLGGEEYYIVYEETDGILTETYRTTDDDLYQKFGKIVEGYDGLYSVEADELLDQNEQKDFAYGDIINYWKQQGIVK